MLVTRSTGELLVAKNARLGERGLPARTGRHPAGQRRVTSPVRAMPPLVTAPEGGGARMHRRAGWKPALPKGGAARDVHPHVCVRGVILLLFLLVLSQSGSPCHAAEKLRFNRDIRRIPSDKCFHFHGPNPKKREADLRLDVRELAVKAGAIVPGKPDESEMLV